MNKIQIQISPSLELLSRAAAERFVELARQRLQEGKIFSVALSGGKTPQSFLRILASPEFSDRIPWESIHIFQVDERCVPPDHPESNYRMIHEDLLASIQNAVPHFYRMKAEEDDLDAASLEYANELQKVLAPPIGAAPRFDLIFLGMGPDGHTASLFPGSAALKEQRKWVCSNYVEKLKASRLTLTYPVLNAAAEIAFLVSGSEKAATLREVLEGPRNQELFPAQGVDPAQGRVTWYIDKPASCLLQDMARNTA